jgi:hypothetical protein
MIHALERTSSFGKVTIENAIKALGLSTLPQYYKILQLSINREKVTELSQVIHEVLKRESASVLYEGLLTALLDTYTYAVFNGAYKNLKVPISVIKETYEAFNSNIPLLIASAKILRECIAEGGPSGVLLSERTLLVDLYRMLNPQVVFTTTMIAKSSEVNTSDIATPSSPISTSKLPWRSNPPPPPVVPDTSPYVNQSNRKPVGGTSEDEVSKAPLIPDTMKKQVQDAKDELERYLQISNSFG